MMPQTFEELAARELGSLYTGSIFLTAGDEERAEALLIETLVEAAQEYREWEPVENAGRWLEGRLAAKFLEADAIGQRVARGTAGRTVSELDPDARALCRAAAAVRPTVRAAVWLVTLRRWRYEDAARVMKADVTRIGELLREREPLLVEFSRARGGGRASGTRVERMAKS